MDKSHQDLLDEYTEGLNAYVRATEATAVAAYAAMSERSNETLKRWKDAVHDEEAARCEHIKRQEMLVKAI
jgi:hypothetical protein